MSMTAVKSYRVHGLRLSYRPADGTFIVGGQTGQVYRTAGGAPLYVFSWVLDDGSQPTVVVDQDAIDNAGSGGAGSPWSHLNYYPADGTWLTGSQTGHTFRVGDGYAYRLAMPPGERSVVIDQAAIDNAGTGGTNGSWNHLRGVR
ncbi:hypothetical protein ACN27F_34320 [Solwaraspora sp. WMMB335]|uniref:hypothetical protein n=1 Tax=Solwaraspora sp. WMMB335 TaxID=3404118 RepID=UPI003B95948C